MTRLDSARSRRSSKPALFATLDMAIIQAGVSGFTTAADGDDAEAAYALSSWSIDQGRRFPWYSYHERHIMESEGGRDAVILQVTGLALALMPNHPTDPKEAFFEAGKDWRDGMRRQWGDGSARAEWHIPSTFTDLQHDQVPGSNERVGDNRLDDWLTEHSIELAPSNQEDFDPENIKDPRLQKLWDTASPERKDFMVLLAEGNDNETIAELRGVGRQAVSNQKVRLRKAALAMGPAA